MPIKVLKNLKLWLPVLLCMAAIFSASSLPASNIPPLFPFQDIAFHFIIYLLLAYFFARALRNTQQSLSYVRCIAFTFLFAFLYALSDEFHQSFIPGRDASFFDIGIDAIGSFFGAIFYR